MAPPELTLPDLSAGNRFHSQIEPFLDGQRVPNTYLLNQIYSCFSSSIFWVMETYNYNPAEKHLPLENFNVLFLEGNEL